MKNTYFRPLNPANIIPSQMAPGTEERRLLKEELERQSNITVDIPVIIGGKEYFTENQKKVTAPHDHSLHIANTSMADKELLQKAVDAAMDAKEIWENIPTYHRFAIFEKAARLLETKYRYIIPASLMLNQSKTAFEADADVPSELCDLIRYDIYNADLIYNQQPNMWNSVTYNRTDYRPLEGFVLAITPFNFSSIGGNLPAAPAIAGNTVVWKPATTATLSCYYIMQAFMEAGLPAGVINFVPSSGRDIDEIVTKNPNLGGVHFTGSTKVFKDMWKTVGDNIFNYRSYPRLVGETGGKDYIFATKNANVDFLVTHLIRGAFENSGQKCSATSRAYVPESIWPEVKEKLISEAETVTCGDPKDFTNFYGAVIDEKAYDSISEYIENAKKSDECEIIVGGGHDKSKGWFIDPTIILTTNPNYVTMIEEIFGPVLTIYVYKDEEYDEMINHCANSSEYALTGAIFTEDRLEIIELEKRLRQSAGNFYYNDKPSGAYTGHQPFGGARGSGTNDKAGSLFNMTRWISPQSIKDNFIPATDYRYDFQKEK